MKDSLKKIMVTILAFTLLIGAIAAPPQQAQAKARKMTKADFKFTGKYKSNFNKVIKKKKKTSKWYVSYANTRNEKSPKKCIKTKRGITLGTSRKKIIKKYGKNAANIETIEIETGDSKPRLKKKIYGFERRNGSIEIGAGFYDRIKSVMSEEDFKLVKNSNMLQYNYVKNHDVYSIIFCFDNKNKVSTIIATQGISEW